MVADSNDAPGRAVQGQTLLADPDRGLHVPRLPVRDGEVEQERCPAPVVEVVGQAARLFEVGQGTRVLTDA